MGSREQEERSRKRESADKTETGPQQQLGHMVGQNTLYGETKILHCKSRDYGYKRNAREKNEFLQNLKLLPSTSKITTKNTLCECAC